MNECVVSSESESGRSRSRMPFVAVLQAGSEDAEMLGPIGRNRAVIHLRVQGSHGLSA